jgi:hypothetical protein
MGLIPEKWPTAAKIGLDHAAIILGRRLKVKLSPGSRPLAPIVYENGLC